MLVQLSLPQLDAIVQVHLRIGHRYGSQEIESIFSTRETKYRLPYNLPGKKQDEAGKQELQTVAQQHTIHYGLVFPRRF